LPQSHSLIMTANMRKVDLQARLADVLARTVEHPGRTLDDMLHWPCQRHDRRQAG
jgi:hypothetical protein